MPISRAQTGVAPAKASRPSASESMSSWDGKKLVLRKQTVSDIRMVFMLTVTSISLMVIAVKYLSRVKQPSLESKLCWIAVVVWGVQWLGYFAAGLFRTEKFYDMFGSGCFLLISWASYLNSKKDTRQALALLLVNVWGLRLMAFLVRRLFRAGRDSRFDEVKSEPLMFWFYWTVQGLWVFVTLLPVMILDMRTHNRRQPPLGPLDYVGVGVWLVGFLIETVADYQKYTFRCNPANASEYIKHGLWATCRHPNYFGETILWLGMFLLCATPLNRAQLAVAFIGPVFVCYVLLRLSGVPILEANANKKWGARQDYKDYVRNSRVFLLLPWRP